MLAVRANPTGIDFWIDFLQRDLYQRLITKLGIDPARYACYARAYRNPGTDTGGFEPAAFKAGDEYIKLYYDDTYDITTFFTIIEPIKSNERVNTAVVNLIVCANLNRLYPDETDRADETLRVLVENYCDHNYGFQKKATFIGFDKTFSEYSGEAKIAAALTDMQPLHCFRTQFEKVYETQNIYCNLPIEKTT